MNRRPLFAMLLLSITLPAAAQQASTPAPAPQPDTPTARDTVAMRDTGKVDRLCLRETGTRIRSRAPRPGARDTCPSVLPGRVYTQDDLRSTGEVDIADALRRLDPSIH